MDKRGEEKTLGLIVTIVILLIMAVIVLELLGTINLVGKELQECQYCAPTCDARTEGFSISARYPAGDEWCERGLWTVDEDRVKALKKYGYDGEAGTASGKALNLQCCSLIKEPDEIPTTFLTKNLREGEADEDGEAAQEPLSVRAYFGDRSYPLRNGESIEAVSDREYEYAVEVEKPEGVSLGTGDEALKCDVRLLNSEDRNVLKADGKTISVDPDAYDTGASKDDAGGSLCNGIIDNYVERDGASAEKSDEWTLDFPSRFQGETFTLEILFTETEGRYDPSAPHDTRYVTSIRVTNPIEIDGLSSEWTREQALKLSCKGVECTNYSWQTVDWGSGCPQDIASEEVTYTSAGVGEIVIDEGGTHNVCIKAETAAGVTYGRSSAVPIRIDRTPPDVRGSFNGFTNNVTCEVSGESACATTFGYYYIRRTVDFVGAVFSGAGDPSWCPSDRREYTFIDAVPYKDDGATARFPYQSPHDFMVLCVMGMDEAGNVDRDILMNYNTISILETIAKKQLSEGGPDTEYYGYQFGDYS